MSAENKLQKILDIKVTAKNTVAYERLEKLFDKDTIVEFDSLVRSEDGLAEVITAYGTIDGAPAYAFAQNGDVAGGAVSKAQAGKIKKIYDFASKTGTPVIGIFDSIGARLKQGDEILAAYGDMLLWSSALSGVVPQISVIVGTCVGTNALIASGADIVIAVEEVDFGIETNGDDKKTEDMEEIIHLVTSDEDEAIADARRIISMLPSNNLEIAAASDFSEPVISSEELNAASRTVGTGARLMSYVISGVVDAGSFIEFQPSWGRTSITGLATIDGETVGIIATRSRYNNGKLDASGCSKAARMVRFFDAFSIPIVTLIDTYGFDSVRSASKLAHAYAEATTVKIAVIVGAAYGPSFVALSGRAANADMTVAWLSSIISPLAPETYSAIMYGDKLRGAEDPATKREELVTEYKETLASPEAAAANGYIDEVIAAGDTRAVIVSALEMLINKKVSRLPKKHSNIQL